MCVLRPGTGSFGTRSSPHTALTFWTGMPVNPVSCGATGGGDFLSAKSLLGLPELLKALTAIAMAQPQ